MKILRNFLLFSLAFFSLFIGSAYADPWVINETWDDGLSAAGGGAFPEAFYTNDRWQVIVTSTEGSTIPRKYGYYWLDSTWVSDPAIKNGLPDIGVWLKTSIFYHDGVFKLIAGEHWDVYHGYYWNGTSWVEDSSIVAGLPSTGTEKRNSPEIFYHDGTWKMIVGLYSGGFTSFYWDDDTDVWVYDGSICAGLGDIGDNAVPAVYEEFGTLYLIAGRGDGLWNGFRWTGTSWVSDSTTIDGLLDVSNYGSPTIFNVEDTWKILIGNGISNFRCFERPFTNIVPVTSELKTEDEINNLQIPSGTTQPTFSWTYYDMNDDEQYSYEIRVGTSLGISDMWSSGTLLGSATSKAYGGLELTDNVAYYVQVRTNDDYEWSAWETGVFVVGISGTTPVVVPVAAPASAPHASDPVAPSIPSEPIPESTVSKTVIEEVVSFITEPFNWVLIVFSYLGAFLGRSLLTSPDEDLKDLIIDTALFGTVAFVLVLFINSFISLVAMGEFVAIFSFAVAGFVLSLLRSLD